MMNILRCFAIQLLIIARSSISTTSSIASVPLSLKQRGIPTPLSTRIIGGTEADSARFPYAVSLQYSGEHFCGGSLIGPDIVLTAGHCNGEFSLNGISYNVVIGRNDLNKFWAGESIKTRKEVRHPQYVDETVENDFNLIFLSRKVSFSNVNYVQINKNPLVPVDDGDGIDELTVVGWGDTDSSDDISDPSDVLIETQLYPITNKDCESSQGLVNTAVGPIFTDLNGGISENMLCAKANGKDACNGDSGGPLVIKGNDATGSDDIQVGIVSWGLGCADKNFPGVYSRISSQYQWIEEQVCTWSMDPPANFDCDGTPTVQTTAPTSPRTPNPTSSPSEIITPVPTLTLTSRPTRSPLPDGQKRLLIKVELDDKPSDTGWKISSIPDDRILFEVAVGEYDSSNLGQDIEYVLVVDSEKFYRLTVYDNSGDGFSGRVTVFEDMKKIAHEPGFTDVSGKEVHHGFYAGESPEKLVMLHFEFDYFAQEVAFELKSLKDDNILALSWFGAYEPSTQSATEDIPIYGHEQGEQNYRLTIWDSGGDGINGQYGEGKYELFLVERDTNTLLTSGGDYGGKEVFEFTVPGNEFREEGTTSATLISSTSTQVQFPTFSPVSLPLPLENPRNDGPPSPAVLTDGMISSPSVSNAPQPSTLVDGITENSSYPKNSPIPDKIDPNTMSLNTNKSTATNANISSSGGQSGGRFVFFSCLRHFLISFLLLFIFC
mmetsp:Transcript_6689/g.13603  ORF Transcript_6689/g.13603 Transcript_6689/m.13603 type:complete len:718 (+) Transcript_6689:322-2475(+)